MRATKQPLSGVALVTKPTTDTFPASPPGRAVGVVVVDLQRIG